MEFGFESYISRNSRNRGNRPVSQIENGVAAGVVTLLFSVLTACSASNSIEKASEKASTINPQTTDVSTADKNIMGPVLTLKTVMTAEGVECAALRGADGTLYTVASMPHTFEAGDKVNIIVADPIIPIASFCQQGQTIEWLRIEWVSASGDIKKYWEK